MLHAGNGEASGEKSAIAIREDTTSIAYAPRRFTRAAHHGVDLLGNRVEIRPSVVERGEKDNLGDASLEETLELE